MFFFATKFLICRNEKKVRSSDRTFFPKHPGVYNNYFRITFWL